MQFVGSLTARPKKNYYVFKLQQQRGISFPNIILIIIMISIKIIIIEYMHSSDSDQFVQSDERSLKDVLCSLPI